MKYRCNVNAIIHDTWDYMIGQKSVKPTKPSSLQTCILDTANTSSNFIYELNPDEIKVYVIKRDSRINCLTIYHKKIISYRFK